MRYAQTENSLHPPPFPGPKVENTAGWTGREVAAGADGLAAAGCGVSEAEARPSIFACMVAGMPTL